MNPVAQQLLNHYPGETLERHYRGFEWKNQEFTTASNKRRELSNTLVTSLKDASESGLVAALMGIHKWGLAGKFPPAVEANTKRILTVLRTAQGPKLQEKEIESLLDLPGIGIATASKWICLVDQDRYAIFDSRVSVALKDICVDGKRSFPIVARRKSARHTPWPSDQVAPERMASFYTHYTDTLAEVGDEVGLTPSQIEMALFMIGDQSCDDPKLWISQRPVLR